MQPIGLAVTNTADIVIAIVIVNYVLRAYLRRKVSLASSLTYWHAKLISDRFCVGGTKTESEREIPKILTHVSGHNLYK